MAVNKSFYAILSLSVLLVACAQQQPTQTSTQATTSTAVSSTQIVSTDDEPLPEVKRAEYVNGGFKVRYPEAWKKVEVTNQVAFADKLDEEGKAPAADATSLTLSLGGDFEDSDVFLGWNEVSKDHTVNWTGAGFDLTYYEPNPSQVPSAADEMQQSDRLVQIETKLIPGLVLFRYNLKTNPLGEKMMRQQLENIIAS